MKRVLKYFIAIITTGTLISFLAAVLWLTGTTSGTRWLLEIVSAHTDLKITMETIEGRLAGGLRMENVDIKFLQTHIKIRHLESLAVPLDLLSGQVSFQNLFLRDVLITDNTPDAPPVMKWPQASGLISFFSAKIERLEVSTLSYRHLEQQPLQLQTIVSSVAWRNSHLVFGNLHIVSDQVVVDGNMLAGFNRPILEMVIVAIPAQPIAGTELFRLTGKFGPGQSHEQLAGNLLISGIQNKQPFWEISADIGMTSEGIPLKNVRLTRPGQRGLITADGMLVLNGPDPFLSLRAQAADIDLSPVIKIPTNLSGSLTFAGTSKQYKGSITLANLAIKEKAWQTIQLAGIYSGNAESVTLSAIQGSAMNGSLKGHLDIHWQRGLAIQGALAGRNLDPARIDPGWKGAINFDISGNLSAKPLSGEIVCTLNQSLLHGQQLSGDLRATFVDDDVRISHLALKGKGFQLTAAGAVKNKLDFTARISDLSRLVPKAAGKLTAQGWARWRNDRPSGVISAQASDLAIEGMKLATADVNAAMEDKDTTPLHLNATVSKFHYLIFKADTLALQAKGTPAVHTLAAVVRSGRYQADLALSGSYGNKGWQGKVLRLDGTDNVGPWRLINPVALSITADSLSLEPLMITGRDSETLKISCKLVSESLTGFVTLDWNALNLARVNFWMNSDLVTGTSSGKVDLKLLPQNRLTLTGKCSASGTLQAQKRMITIGQGEFTLEANEQGTRIGMAINLAGGGTVQGTFSSSAPARLALPDDGLVNLSWQELEFTPFSAWVPGRVKLEGKIMGQANGKLLTNQRFTLMGHTALAQSKIQWQGERGDVSVDLREASLDFVWQEEALSGDITVTMAEYGKLQGRFRLPIAARFPVSMDTGGSLQAALSGQLREKGALGVLFPGLVRESRGELELDLKIGGSWVDPQVLGNVYLSKAGAYLPSAGISIKDAIIAAHLDMDAVYIDSFRAASGQGYIEGSAIVRLKGWQVVSYEGSVKGERFQTIYFPELQVQSSPKLTFDGTPKKLSIRGEILLPDVQVIGSQSRGPVEGSTDVIREGKTKPAAKKLPFDLNVEVKLVLGDSVLFKAAGIDAKMDGQLDLKFQELDKIKSRGEIRVVRGNFQSYGVSLDIIRGRLFYAGGPLNQPALDILAWRKIGDVKAGVLVSGTLQNPLVKLYSEPFMQDTDILAYIVLGYPLSKSTNQTQANLMVMAASALLTSKQSVEVQRQIKNRLGFATFEIKSDVMGSNGYMGYKPIKVAPGGGGSTEQAITSSGSAETMLVVGKYLTPDIYISYGHSLFSGGNLLFLRYDINKNWQIETQTGDVSGVDIYYKLEFN